MMDRSADRRPVVVAVDHTGSAHDAAEWAADLAAAWGAPLDLNVALVPDEPPNDH